MILSMAKMYGKLENFFSTFLKQICDPNMRYFDFAQESKIPSLDLILIQNMR